MPQFVKVYPQDYRKALEEHAKVKQMPDEKEMVSETIASDKN